ncbi:LacI family transcriptional regulator (plasmid) [Rhizobium grahamii]|uniref:LacI family transcriptional regulator n=1 Tax=Rhizobium grahamii TaxID=1120045 RepID=A0A5Q0CEJ0_9HYPH|nr:MULTISPECIES: LacI family DNA-binding transcriptional regulator [Rhizobium]QFY63763.1 LacI family transcriptional regulator [Rhizobium grahamii]QRM51475.1 LacI family transcriptional regulator [Rhizobium sp. BG6]
MKNQIVTATQERITIRHVAQDAGVSVAAVSKVLRNAYGVSEVLRSKVEASIEKLNYRPSVAARGMRGRTYTVGILVIELSNPFLAGVIESANTMLSDNGYKSLIGIGRSASPIEASMIESMIDNRMDGVLIIAPRISGKVLERYARQIPIAVIAHHEPHAQTYDTVNSDDRKGAALAVEVAVKQGYRDIAMLGYDFLDSPSTVVALQREMGYVAAMKQAGLESRIIRLPPVAENREAAIRDFLVTTDRPRAVFVWSDLDAVPLINAARTSGIRVPEDLAIIGYDNSPMAAIPLVGLTSVDQNAVQLGRTASEVLMGRIDGRQEARHLLIEPHVELRGST